MEETRGNILNVDHGIVCQQVNCRGVMGCGVAKQIRNKWPRVYEVYRRLYERQELKLGYMFLVTVGDDLLVANLCGQDRYGRDKCYTDYMALGDALQALSKWRGANYVVTGRPLPVYVPYKMGCSNAGGNWETVITLVNLYLPDAIVVRR